MIQFDKTAIVKVMWIGANPFITSYLEADGLGKAIFFSLFLTSCWVWTVILHKMWIFWKVKQEMKRFSAIFSKQDPLNTQFSHPIKRSLLEIPHPLFEVYKVFKQYALKLINKYHTYFPEGEIELSESDLNLLESEIYTTMSLQMKKLEKSLFVLATAQALAPFLGLLGTVWGILTTFSKVHVPGQMTNSAAMLSGLSLALTTTVAGLVIAIFALLFHNYFKNVCRDLRGEMEQFSQSLLTSIELNYKRPAYAPKQTSSL